DSRRCTASSKRTAASCPTGASGWATIEVRSAPTANPRSSSASRRAVAEPDARSRAPASDRSSPIVGIRLVPGRAWRSEPDRDRQVADLPEDLGARGAEQAVAPQVARRLAHAEVVERHAADPVRQVRVAQLQLALSGVG